MIPLIQVDGSYDRVDELAQSARATLASIRQQVAKATATIREGELRHQQEMKLDQYCEQKEDTLEMFLERDQMALDSGKMQDTPAQCGDVILEHLQRGPSMQERYHSVMRAVDLTIMPQSLPVLLQEPLNTYCRRHNKAHNPDVGVFYANGNLMLTMTDGSTVSGHQIWAEHRDPLLNWTR